MEQFLSSLDPTLLALIRVLLILGLVLTIVPGLIWYERRLLSWMQDRIGPNRVGPFGLLQPIADGVKLFLKEDITPNSIDRFIYFLAPAVALFPAFVLAGVLPFGPQEGVWGYLTPISNANIGILWILAMSSLGVYGVVLAGYAANNKYSLMGGLRASAQLISYELAMGVSLACIVLAAGSLRLTDIVVAQEGPLWGFLPFLQNWYILTPFGFLAFVIFLICMVAETNRAPFDLPEAENELIAGYHTEYSSMKFAVFFMGEYAAMFIFSGVVAVMFLGGYNIVPVNWDWLAGNFPGGSEFFGFIGAINYWMAPLTFIGKCALGITFYVWLRATLPRLRYDQLMALGWKTLLPVAAANMVIVAAWVLMNDLAGPLISTLATVGLVVLLIGIYALFMRVSQARGSALERHSVSLTSGKETRRGIDMVDPGVGSGVGNP
ncbi:MAG: NADH-quinone oxidoreductase subunit NuoH [Fimbriimonadaceae bacterium]